MAILSPWILKSLSRDNFSSMEKLSEWTLIRLCVLFEGDQTMKHVVQIVTLAASLCIFIGIVPSGKAFAEAQKEKEKITGLIAFDFPNAMEAKVEVNLSGKLISLVAKAAKPNPEVTELLDMLKGVYVRVYEKGTTTFNELVHHYEDKLEKEKWEVIAKVKEETETVQVRILLGEDTIFGLFVMVAGETEVTLVNIVGEINPERIGELLANLDNLGLPHVEGMDIKTDDMSKSSKTDEPKKE